jgi:hypothetical protein
LRCLRGLTELSQKSDFVVEEKAQVINPVPQHGQAFYTEAKRVTSVLVIIDANVPKYFRVNHAAAEYLQPSALLANAATAAFTEDAAYVHFGRRLGEWEI